MNWKEKFEELKVGDEVVCTESGIYRITAPGNGSGIITKIINKKTILLVWNEKKKYNVESKYFRRI